MTSNAIQGQKYVKISQGDIQDKGFVPRSEATFKKAKKESPTALRFDMIPFVLSKISGAVSSVVPSCFSKVYHLVGRNLHVQPIQSMYGWFASGDEAYITLKDITKYKRGLIQTGDRSPEKLEATRVLLTYLQHHKLQINKFKNIEILRDCALTLDEVEMLNKLLAPVIKKAKSTEAKTCFCGFQRLFPAKITEKQITSRIHASFAALVKGTKSKDLALARGIIAPLAITQKIDHSLSEELRQFRPKEDSAATVYANENSLETPQSHLRVSELKKGRQTSPINHHVHVFQKETKEAVFIRHGAPATHGGTKLQTLLDRLKPGWENAYDAYNAIIKDTTNNEDAKELKQKVNQSIAQMLTITESAIDASRKLEGTDPFYFAEIGLLSPEDKKERSLLLQSYIAMRSIEDQFSINPVSKKIEKKTPKNASTNKPISFLFINQAINEKKITKLDDEDKINAETLKKLEKRIKQMFPSDLSGWTEDNDKVPTPPDTQRTLDPEEEDAQINALLPNSNRNSVNLAMDDSDNKQFALLRATKKNLKTILTNPERPYGDVEFVETFHLLCRALDIPVGIFCKSGKDRTAQVTAHLATKQLELKEEQKEGIIRGVSLKLTSINTDKREGYVFNSWQREHLHKDLRPPLDTCNSSVSA